VLKQTTSNVVSCWSNSDCYKVLLNDKDSYDTYTCTTDNFITAFINAVLTANNPSCNKIDRSDDGTSERMNLTSMTPLLKGSDVPIKVPR